MCTVAKRYIVQHKCLNRVSDLSVLIFAGVVVPSNNALPAASGDDGDFAEFASFQASPLPQLTTQPHLEPKTKTNNEMTSLSSYQPHFTSSLSVSGNSSSVVSGNGASDKYQMIKELISNPTLFTSGPSPAGTLNENTNAEWSDFQEPSSVSVFNAGIQNSSDADFCPSSSTNDSEWADFRSTSAASDSLSTQAVHMDSGKGRSLPDIDTKEPAVRTKSSVVSNYSGATGWFGIQQNQAVHSRPSHALFSSGALDFCPPELPPENDEDDSNDIGFYSVSGMHGISSLSALDLEDEPVDAVRNGGGLLNAGVRGMTTSNSASSFEFTGWQQRSKHSLPVPAADTQSTSSLDLRPVTDPSSRSPDRSPSQPAVEADSQSECSFEFVPPSETRIRPSGIAGADSDRMSLQSLELKSTIVSPEEEPSSGIGRDDAMQVTCQSLGGGMDSAPVNSGMT